VLRVIKKLLQKWILKICVTLEIFPPQWRPVSAYSIAVVSFPRTYPIVFRLMYTADFGSMGQFYLAIPVNIVFFLRYY
jgi:hypothetical protein